MHLECFLIFSSLKVVQTIPLVESSQEAKLPLQDFPTTPGAVFPQPCTSHQEHQPCRGAPQPPVHGISCWGISRSRARSTELDATWQGQPWSELEGSVTDNCCYTHPRKAFWAWVMDIKITGRWNPSASVSHGSIVHYRNCIHCSEPKVLFCMGCTTWIFLLLHFIKYFWSFLEDTVSHATNRHKACSKQLLTHMQRRRKNK